MINIQDTKSISQAGLKKEKEVILYVSVENIESGLERLKIVEVEKDGSRNEVTFSRSHREK